MVATTAMMTAQAPMTPPAMAPRLLPLFFSGLVPRVLGRAVEAKRVAVVVVMYVIPLLVTLTGHRVTVQPGLVKEVMPVVVGVAPGVVNLIVDLVVVIAPAPVTVSSGGGEDDWA